MKTSILAFAFVALCTSIASAEKLGVIKVPVQTYKGIDKFKTEFIYKGHVVMGDGSHAGHFKSPFRYRSFEHAESELKDKIDYIKKSDKQANYYRYAHLPHQVTEVVGWVEKLENLPDGTDIVPRDQ